MRPPNLMVDGPGLCLLWQIITLPTDVNGVGNERQNWGINCWLWEREMFYLTTHSTHFIYSYMASDIWLRTILIVRKETRCRHIGYSYRLTAKVLLHAPSHRQDNTYHGVCYTSCGALAGARNSSMGPPHEGSIRRPTAPWANALPLSYIPPLVGCVSDESPFTLDFLNRRGHVLVMTKWTTRQCHSATAWQVWQRIGYGVGWYHYVWQKPLPPPLPPTTTTHPYCARKGHWVVLPGQHIDTFYCPCC